MNALVVLFALTISSQALNQEQIVDSVKKFIPIARSGVAEVENTEPLPRLTSYEVSPDGRFAIANLGLVTAYVNRSTGQIGTYYELGDIAPRRSDRDPKELSHDQLLRMERRFSIGTRQLVLDEVMNALVALTSSSQALNQEQIVDSVKKFIPIARSGVAEVENTEPLPRLTSYEVSPDGRFAIVDMDRIVGIVDRSNGQIGTFAEFGDTSPRRSDRDPNQLSRDQLLRLANRYYQKAGYTEDLLLYHVDEIDDNGIQVFDLHLLPMIDGVPVGYEDYVSMTVEHVTGRLKGFGRRELPRRPASLTPRLSLEEGRVRVLQELFNFRPRIDGVYERQPLRLIIWKPNNVPPGAFSSLSSPEIQAGRQGQGRLVYWAYYHSLATAGTRLPWTYEVFLDANTGRMLTILPMEGGGSGGGPSRPVAKPVSLDFPKGLVSVLIHGRWSKVVASIKGVEPKPISSKQSTPVTLGIGRAFIRANFDPTSGLLFIQTGNSSKFGKPSETLRRVLAKNP